MANAEVIFPTMDDATTANESTVTLAAVGDVIVHGPIYSAAYQADTKNYDFEPMFEDVKPYLEAADIAVGVLETTLGSETEKKFTGYPSFKSPPSIADAMVNSGIDILFTAHNHSLDYGETGVINTNKYLQKNGYLHVGCNNRGTEPKYIIVEKNGLKLAFFSYTTFVNGVTTTNRFQHLVNALNYKELQGEILSAKIEGADGIILALHTGVEYKRIPSKEQESIVERLFSLGVDVVLGSHVHVVQRYESREIQLDENNAKKSFVAYSLGNFISNQQWQYSDTGLMITLELRKNPIDGLDVTLQNRQPIWVYRFRRQDGLNDYRVKLVNESSEAEEMDLADETLNNTARQRLNAVRKEIKEICGE